MGRLPLHPQSGQLLEKAVSLLSPVRQVLMSETQAAYQSLEGHLTSEDRAPRRAVLFVGAQVTFRQSLQVSDLQWLPWCWGPGSAPEGQPRALGVP